jgi:hypothetical protein
VLLRFAKEGSKVACLDINQELNEKTAEECRALGVDAVAIPLMSE